MAGLRRSGGLVLAAGGVVWRPGPAGVEILVVHRPRYDDWTFPKGKAAPGEEGWQTALREVEEETGLRCRLGPELAGSRYVDPAGRPKQVRYWAMTVDEGEFRPNREVDEVRWVPRVGVPAALTYRRDLDVLQSLDRAVEVGELAEPPDQRP